MTKQKITPRAPTPNGAPQIVLFGLDQDKKPRAGRFSARDAELAKKAAQAMSLEVCQVASPELTEIAVKLPMGRLHAQGRAFVPYVRQDLFAKLAEAAGKHGRVEASNPPTDQAASPAAGKADETPPITAALPRGWHDIAAGHMVLAHEGLADGWWECIVEERTGDMLKLRVRDYPKYKKFVQHVTAVALVYPPTPGI